MIPDSTVADHVKEHGDGVKVVALWVDDAAKSWKENHPQWQYVLCTTSMIE